MRSPAVARSHHISRGSFRCGLDACAHEPESGRGLLHDKASCFKALVSDGMLNDTFKGGVEMAAGKAPDMTQLDAAFCPFMWSGTSRRLEPRRRTRFVLP